MYKHTAKRRFGQNFLSDEFIINQIIKIIQPKNNDFIVEIGPGLAALTRPILELIPTLHVIEIDRDIIAYLREQFATNLIIHEGDALNFDYNIFNQQAIRVIGNLPYNISTPLLFHLAQFEHIIDMYFMLQKEVVDRIVAKPNCHAYGRLSIMLQYKFNCVKMLDVKKESFHPVPKVESAIIHLTKKPKEEWQSIDAKKLNFIVSQAFNQRRKTISNSLGATISRDTLKELDIDPQKRAENLTVSEYILLSKIITLP
jgi:16S rRNA (adenine1518-N6/adenine1519-N6)-dimethyltransferase